MNCSIYQDVITAFISKNALCHKVICLSLILWKKHIKHYKGINRNIANPIVLLLLLPTGLGMKFKFLEKIYKALHGLVLSNLLQPPSPQYPILSVIQECAQAGSGMLLPTHFCLLFIPVTAVPWHIPHSTHSVETTRFCGPPKLCSYFYHGTLFWCSASNYLLVCLPNWAGSLLRPHHI